MLKEPLYRRKKAKFHSGRPVLCGERTLLVGKAIVAGAASVAPRLNTACEGLPCVEMKHARLLEPLD